MFDRIREDGRPVVMGILNVTPDSFSDGGRHATTRAALEHAVSMHTEGADIIDIGGESTRPGAKPVSDSEQIERVVPVIKAIRDELGDDVRLSVDTRSTEVAAAALTAGACIVNDVSGARSPDMLELVARRRAGLVIMHMQGTPETMQDAPHYDDVVVDILAWLSGQARAAEQAGIPAASIAIDPGIGFGKTREHNLRLLANLACFSAGAYPVLLGTSRKRFMGAICSETEPGALLGATCATTAMGVLAGVSVFRVHDVKANRQAADVAWACKGLGA